MIISGGKVFLRGRSFLEKDVYIRDGRFTFRENGHEPDRIDASGCYVIPGLIDIHTHGCLGYEFCDADPDKLAAMSRYYLKNGVTSFLGSSLTLDEPALTKAYNVLRGFACSDGARMPGINMEGPFFSVQKRGAQPLDFLRKPDFDMFMRLHDTCGGGIKIVCVAPELEGALEFIRRARDVCTVSIAHTCATYDQAIAAFEAGATHVTHLFNGMNSFLHREPGVIGAAADRGAYVELISDGHHIHPAMVRSVYKLFDPERICMISDSLSCAGLSDGEYSLGGQHVTVRDGRALLDDGTIAGSSINVMTALRRAVSFGVRLEDAIIACTAAPADAIRMGGALGRIDEGFAADCLVLDKGLNILHVVKDGKRA